MSWWCHWPNHGGIGLKPVEDRAVWLCWLLCIVVANKKISLRAPIAYCRQDYVCRCFWQVVHAYSGSKKKERGKFWPSPTQKCCIGISFVSARQGRVSQKCRHLAVGPTCRRHISNIASQGIVNPPQEVLNHIMYVCHRCGMQFERLHSLDHYIVV